MNIDEMQAGREMDALVAEKVMGWNQVYYRDGRLLGLPPEAMVMWGENITPHLLPVLSYSADIEAAWDITTRMNDAVFLLERSLTANDSWRARFGRHEDGRLIGTMTRGTASTPALAICRAALKLMEGKDAHDQPAD